MVCCSFSEISTEITLPKVVQSEVASIVEVNRSLAGYEGQDSSLISNQPTLWATNIIEVDNYLAQPNDWTCGVASYLMVMKQLGIDAPDFEDTVKMLKSNDENGTDPEQIVAAMDMLSVPTKLAYGTGADLNTLAVLLKEKFSVIIDFREPEEGIGHYAVVQGLNTEAIQLADPWYGPESILPLEQFDWRNGDETHCQDGIYIAVKLCE